MWVVGIVAGVTLACIVVQVTRSEGAGQQGLLRVTPNRGDLLGKLENDSLVDGRSVVRGRVLEGRSVNSPIQRIYKRISPGVAG